MLPACCQSFALGSNLTISPSIRISNGVIITNYGTVNMQNNITGGNVNSQWVNAANSVLNMGGNTSTLLSTGTLDASAVPNTVNYNGLGNQPVKAPSAAGYYNQAASGSGSKSLPGAVTINNDIQIADAAQLSAGANAITLIC